MIIKDALREKICEKIPSILIITVFLRLDGSTYIPLSPNLLHEKGAEAMSFFYYTVGNNVVIQYHCKEFIYEYKDKIYSIEEFDRFLDLLVFL